MMRSGIQAGFTLVEILVAITVFSVLSMLSYGGMNRVLGFRDDVQSRIERLENLQMAFAMISNDLEHAVNRPVRDRLGSSQPAFESRPDSEIRLALTTGVRSHWQFKEGSSSLRRIEYEVGDGKLVRRQWPVLDRAHGSEPESTQLVAGMADIKFEFINLGSHDFWPLPDGHAEYRILPRAVEVTFSYRDGVDVQRLLLVDYL